MYAYQMVARRYIYIQEKRNEKKSNYIRKLLCAIKKKNKFRMQEKERIEEQKQ